MQISDDGRVEPEPAAEAIGESPRVVDGPLDEHRARVRELFLAVCDARPSRRRGILERECRWEPEIRAEVEALLARDGGPLFRARVFHELGVPRTGVDAAAGIPRPTRVGPWHVAELLCEGDLVDVYRADRLGSGQVAELRVGQAWLEDPAERARVAHELARLSRLDAPRLARVLDAGVAETLAGPRAYVASEPPAGESLRLRGRDPSLTLEDRLRLLHRVCLAVHDAHQRGIVHGSLSPDDVVVGGPAGVCVAGFGFPVRADELLEGHAHAAELPGTAPYLAPEQLAVPAGDDAEFAAGAPSRPWCAPADDTPLDVRVDVHALGVIAYELLAGRRPRDLSACTLEEAARLVREVDVPPLRRWDEALAGDVEAIVGKAMAPEPEDRYASAAQMADDIERHLEHETISARKAGAGHELIQLARRNRALAVVLGVMFLAPFVGFVVSAGLLGDARRAAARDRTAAAAVRAGVLARADQLAEAGSLELSEQLVADLVDGSRRTLGAEHLTTARLSAELALVRLRAGRSAEAEEAASAALPVLRAALGETADDVQRTLRHRAVARWLGGRADDALADLVELVQLQQRTGNPEWSQTRELLADWRREAAAAATGPAAAEGVLPSE